MLRHPYRIPAVYFLIYAAAGLIYTYQDYVVSLWVEESPPSGFGIDDPPIQSGPIAKFLYPFALALLPALFSLAGAATARATRDPPKSWVLASVLVSFVPLVAGYYLINSEVQWAYPYVMFSVVEVAMIAVLVSWVIAPVILTRALYRCAVP